MDFIFLFLKLIFSLTAVLGLMFLTFKLSGNKLNKINGNKYIKILERAQISKDASIVVVKIGNKGYTLSITNNQVEKLDELSYEDIELIEENKMKEKEKINEQYYVAMSGLKSKLSRFYKKNN